MNQYSVTQTTNLTAIVGVIVMVLNHFNVNVGSEEIMGIIGAIITIVSIVTNFINRYKKGDVTVSGLRK